MKDDYRREFMPSQENDKKFKKPILEDLKALLREFEDGED